jgi:hypothetical protein
MIILEIIIKILAFLFLVGIVLSGFWIILWAFGLANEDGSPGTRKTRKKKDDTEINITINIIDPKK